MNHTSQAIHLVEELVRAKIFKKTTTELLDYVKKEKIRL